MTDSGEMTRRTIQFTRRFELERGESRVLIRLDGQGQVAKWTPAGGLQFDRWDLGALEFEDLGQACCDLFNADRLQKQAGEAVAVQQKLVLFVTGLEELAAMNETTNVGAAAAFRVVAELLAEKLKARGSAAVPPNSESPESPEMQGVEAHRGCDCDSPTTVHDVACPAASDQEHPARVHDLKLDAKWFGAVVSGEKTAELRLNDRGYAVGDRLRLHELQAGFTGAVVEATVTHVLSDFEGLREGWVMLSFKVVGQ